MKVVTTPLHQWAQSAAPAALPGKVVRVAERGSLPVIVADARRGVLIVGEDGPRLDLTAALEQGRAVCLESHRELGAIDVVTPTPPRTGPLILGAIAALAQRVRKKPELMVKLARLRLELPDDLSASRPENWRFACEMALLAATKDVEGMCRELEASGHRAVRVVENDDARAFVIVDPSARAITVAFRPGMSMKLVSFGIDRTMVVRDGVRMPRGMANYVDRIKDELDTTVQGLLTQYPEARLVVTGGSLGAGAATNWVSRGLTDGALDPTRIARVDVFAPLGGVSRGRVDEMRAMLGPRLAVLLGNGDWMATMLGANDYGASLIRIGKKKPMRKAHALGHLMREFAKQERA